MYHTSYEPPHFEMYAMGQAEEGREECSGEDLERGTGYAPSQKIF